MPIRGPDWAPIDNRILESGISLRKSRQQPAIIRPPDHICALGIATIEGKDGPDLAGGGGMEAGTDLLLGGELQHTPFVPRGAVASSPTDLCVGSSPLPGSGLLAYGRCVSGACYG
jgi:hypothetical protein